MTPLSLERAIEGTRLVDMALTEVGHGGLVRVASPMRRAQGFGIEWTVGQVPGLAVAKARLLAQLRYFGPEHRVTCPNCSANRVHAACPTYAVGEILALGAGCPETEAVAS